MAQGDSHTGLEWQERDWSEALNGVLREPESIEILFQPIVDLRRGTVWGHEALTRFPGPAELDSDRWLDAALRLGFSANLQGVLLSRILGMRDKLAPGCHVAINIRPDDLGSAYVQNAITAGGDLNGVVFEITDHTTFPNAEIKTWLEPIRNLGGLIAIDNVGASYSGLSRINRLRPNALKIDRHMIAHIDQDPERIGLLESLTLIAQRIGALVIVEGIESLVELDTVISLDVPLGQGFGLGRPSTSPEAPDAEVAEHIRDSQLFRVQQEGLTGMVVPAEAHSESTGQDRIGARFAADPDLKHIVVVDSGERPAGLVSRTGNGTELRFTRPLLINSGSTLSQVAHQAMTRPEASKFDPGVFCDELDRYVGLIAMEDLIEGLAENST